MGKDSLAGNMPIITLRESQYAGCMLGKLDAPPVAIWKLACNPKGFWKAWKDDILRLKCDWRIAPMELKMLAKMRCSTGFKDVTILVDTGAKIPIAFRKGLLEPSALKKAQFRVHFSVENGQPMDGGTHGTYMELHIPVRCEDRSFVVKTTPLFAYEANI